MLSSSYDGEIRQGKNTADAAKAAGVKYGFFFFNGAVL